MITEEEWRRARDRGVKFLEDVGIVPTPEEKERMEVVY
jgi:hypothetical protein